jgi:predicted RNA-binding Zn-ribbon protein involved in translation (DUF1610 family)
MEKKEARIKCTGCGTKFKVKIPVTDRPVSFTCRKCGKILKLRLKSGSHPVESLPSMPPEEESAPPEFETTQLPDDSMQTNVPVGPSIVSAFDELGDQAPIKKREETPGSFRTGVGWLVLMGEQVTGPYKSSEIAEMVKNGAIHPETSIRMGERPWVQAMQVPDLRRLFPKDVLNAVTEKPDDKSVKPAAQTKQKARIGPAKQFYQDFGGLISFPVARGNWEPLAIFAGITFVLSSLLCFNFLIGLPLNIVGWILLYGYLFTVMDNSSRSPEAVPPDWDFSRIGEMIQEGGKVFIILALLSLLPLTVLLLMMIVGYENGFNLIGFLSMVLIPVVFLISLCFVPGGLIRHYSTQSIGSAINPPKLIGLVFTGGKPYGAIMLLSIILGLLCMMITLLSVFLTDLPGLGFIIAGFAMAAVFSLAHFIWFHAMGRLIQENKKLTY